MFYFTELAAEFYSIFPVCEFNFAVCLPAVQDHAGNASVPA